MDYFIKSFFSDFWMSNRDLYGQNVGFENVRGSSRSPVQTRYSVTIWVLLNLSKFYRISFCEKFFES
jgi:hypothetical protein